MNELSKLGNPYHPMSQLEWLVGKCRVRSQGYRSNHPRSSLLDTVGYPNPWIWPLNPDWSCGTRSELVHCPGGREGHPNQHCLAVKKWGKPDNQHQNWIQTWQYTRLHSVSTCGMGEWRYEDQERDTLLCKSNWISMDIDIELKSIESIVLLWCLIGILNWFTTEKVQICHVTKKEIFRVSSFVTSMSQSEMRWEIVSIFIERKIHSVERERERELIWWYATA